MELIAARTGDDAGRCAARAAVLRRRALREDPELGDRLDGKLEGIAAVHPVHVLRTVDQIHVLFRPHAVHRIRLALAQASTCGADAGRQRRDAGLQQAELREVPAVERQIDKLAAGDDPAERVRGRVDELSVARDGHGLGERPHLQLCVEADRLAHVHLDRRANERRELRRRDSDAVLADRQEQQPVEAVGAGRRFFDEAGLEVFRDDMGAGNGARSLVGDPSFNRPGCVLGGRAGRCEQAQEQSKRQRLQCHLCWSRDVASVAAE